MTNPSETLSSYEMYKLSNHNILQTCFEFYLHLHHLRNFASMICLLTTGC